MSEFLITLPEIAQVLKYTGDRAELHARKWLYKHGLKQFTTGRYVREQFEELLKERKKKCLQSENAGSFTTSEGQFVWETRQSKSQKGLLDFANQAMQKNMSVA